MINTPGLDGTDLHGLKMGYSMHPGFPTHRNCANFRDGICTLYGVAVDPNGSACPSFTAKSIMETPQAARTYSRGQQYLQPHPPQTMQGYPPYIPTPPQIGYPPMPNYPFTLFPYLSPPQTEYGYLSPHGYPPWMEYGSQYMIDPWGLLQVGYGSPYQYSPGYGYHYKPPAYPYSEYPYEQYSLAYAPILPATYPTTPMPTMVPLLGPSEGGYLEQQRAALEQQVNALQEELKRIKKRLREMRG